MNMSHCRFRNTSMAFAECMTAVQEMIDDPIKDHALSNDELKAAQDLAGQALDFLNLLNEQTSNMEANDLDAESLAEMVDEINKDCFDDVGGLLLMSETTKAYTIAIKQLIEHDLKGNVRTIINFTGMTETEAIEIAAKAQYVNQAWAWYYGGSLPENWSREMEVMKNEQEKEGRDESLPTKE